MQPETYLKSVLVANRYDDFSFIEHTETYVRMQFCVTLVKYKFDRSRRDVDVQVFFQIRGAFSPLFQDYLLKMKINLYELKLVYIIKCLVLPIDNNS